MTLPLRSPQLQVINGRVRAKSFHRKAKRTRAEKAEDVEYPRDIERPRTRQECVGHEGPCPYVSCRHHLYLDVTSDGTVKINFPDRDPMDLEHSCSLDLADYSNWTLEEVGAFINLTRERARQIEMMALAKMSESGVEFDRPDVVDPEALPSLPKHRPEGGL